MGDHCHLLPQIDRKGIEQLLSFIKIFEHLCVFQMPLNLVKESIRNLLCLLKLDKSVQLLLELLVVII
jgi:hypothetical protein